MGTHRAVCGWVRDSGIPAFFLVCGVAILAGPGRAQDFLIGAGEEWRFLEGVAEPPPEWVEVDFDDSDWLTGPTRIGYGEGFIYDTTLTGMQDNYVSVYLRRAFEVPDLNALEYVFLDIDYDDGFVAYLNGEEIARGNMEGLTGDRPAFDTPAIDSHTSTVDGGDVEEFLLDSDLLVQGTNVLAVQAHNEGLASTDFSVLPRLFSDDLCPQDLACNYDFEEGVVTLTWRNRTPYDSVRVQRNGRLFIPNIGDQTVLDDLNPPEGDVVYEIIATESGIPCDPLACTVTVGPIEILIEVGEEWRFFRGREEPSPAADGSPTTAWTGIDFDDSGWEVGPTGIGYGDGDDATVLEDMQNNYLSFYMRRAFDIDPATVSALFLEVDYCDAYVAYLNGTEISRHGLVGFPPAFDQESTSHEAGVPEVIQVQDPRGLLVAGQNVVALQVHNTRPSSSDASMIPRLFFIEREIPPEVSFVRGDANSDGQVNISDGIFILGFLFVGEAQPDCLAAARASGAPGGVNIADAVFLFNWLFAGGVDPPPPTPSVGAYPAGDCGPDPLGEEGPGCVAGAAKCRP